ncbi:MAG: hypothetical protein CVU56_03670 [Deltaproteobacteria bacterium HGW-Deltaproteobacteria-14]|jgi:hypothetical protein|nr:MAG: hypothetical protein CVU56_03670 [Deltaproteobacteria bacterium HGW-Deltaproteobacteria-14]
MRRSASLPHVGRAARLRRALTLAALTCCVAGCPTTPSPPNDTGVDGDADADTSDPDTHVIAQGACVDALDCEVGGALPACKIVECVDERCVVSDLADGIGCDDGDPCSTGETCASGVCLGDGGCNDDNPCTSDGCDPDSGCVHTFNQTPCDDGSGCTSDDRCFQGACVGVELDCDDQKQCTEDSCDPLAGCQHAPRTGPCDDGDACTKGDACASGVCEPGPAVVCGDPDNVCVSGTCDPLTGCQIEILSGPCDDSNACTAPDSCVEGTCTGPTIACDDGNPCTDDYCDTAAGCTTVDNVLPCDDGDVCTVDDVCHAGLCAPGAANPLCCDVGDDAACDDANPCTVDLCDGGLCANTPLDCDDGFGCTADRCDAGTCVSAPWGPAPDAPLTVSDFEGGAPLDGWLLASNNAQVSWQVDALDPHAGAASLYCGNLPAHSYDFGATLATASRTLALPPGQVTLRLWTRLSLAENASCIFDVLKVSVDDTELTPLCSSVAVWTEQTYVLDAFAGRDVTLTFTFDTFDDQANDGGGVWIDDLTLEVTSDLDCCVDAADCDDADPCTTDACAASSSCVHTALQDCP